jgi:hypothetical protein
MALLGFQVGTWNCATACTTHARVANPIVVQQTPQNNDQCGWIGVQVSPMTAAFAESLDMAEPCVAIFDQPQLGSPQPPRGSAALKRQAEIFGGP